MALKFTRSKYDLSELEQLDAQNLNKTNYMLNIDAHENKSSCYPNSDIRNSVSQISKPISDGKLNLYSKADIESKLQNRHVELNSIDKLNNDFNKVKINNPTNCNVESYIGYEDTRFTHPIESYRELNTMEYKFSPYLHINPQNVMAENNYWMNINRNGSSTRIESKAKIGVTSKSQGLQAKKYKGFLPSKFNKTNMREINNNNVNF